MRRPAPTGADRTLNPVQSTTPKQRKRIALQPRNTTGRKAIRFPPRPAPRSQAPGRRVALSRNRGRRVRRGALDVSLDDEYVAFPLLSDLADYGVPQKRVRSFITCVRRGEACLKFLAEREVVPYPVPTHSPDQGGKPVSLAQALKSLGLPELDAGSAASARSDHALHFVPVWRPEQYRMMAAVPAGSGASAWENDDCPACGREGLPRDLACCPYCGARLLRPHVAKDGRVRLVKGFRRSSYRRLSPDRPAATITTSSNRIGSDRTIYRFENRVLSPLECQRLQTLPEDFEWGDVIARSQSGLLREMIGEAVPPRFTKAHGEVLTQLLDNALPRHPKPDTRRSPLDTCRYRRSKTIAQLRLRAAGRVRGVVEECLPSTSRETQASAPSMASSHHTYRDNWDSPA